MAYTGIQSRARDSARKADLATIEKAIRVFEVENGRFPTEAEGANGQVGEGAGIDAMLEAYISTVPHDPIADANHYYYYDGAHSCGGHTTSAVLFAYGMEGSFDDGSPCSSYGGEGGSNQAGVYHIRLGDAS